MKKIAPENLLTKLQTLEQVVNTGNTVSNSIEITGNITVSQNVSIGGLTSSYVPFVGTDNYLEDSAIRKDNGNIIISADTEITGDLLVTGNSYVVSSNNVVIEDRILGLANNNPSHDYDTGIIMEHPGHNVALIHHGDEDRFSMGYTQNTITDNHVLPDSNIFLLDILGNVTVQNNLTVGSGGSYFGDGTTLTGVALETDLIDNVSRISVLETDLTSNASRVGVLETDLASNASRVGVLETDLASNASRIGVVETDLASNALRIGVVETDLASNASRISVVETDLASNALRIGVLETDLTSNASRIGVVETDLASNALRIGVLETDLTSNASRIGVLEQQNLDDIANIGNVISNTVLFTNTDIGIVATGNIHANYFKGDGSNLTGIATTLQSVSDFGNTTSNTIQFTNTDTSLITLGSVGIANTNPTCDLAIGSNVCFNDTSSNVLTIEGNILAHRITLDSIQIASIYALEYVTQTGNTTSNTIEFTNESTGLVTTANVGIANSNPIHTLDVASNLWVDDVGSNVLYVNGNVHMAGAQVTTDGKVGISNTNPQHDLSVASNLYVDDDGSNVLVVHGDASFGSTITLGAVQITAAYTLEEVTGEGNVTSNVIQFTNSNVGIISSGGIIINKDAYACKHYAYSNVNVPTDFSNVSMTFASNVFHAKITAQLTHGNEEVSTMILDVQGGTRDGTTSSLNIASGPGSVFGNTNTKPWSGSVGTTPTSVILEPSEIGTTAYGIDLYVEYKSSATDGKLESISIGTDSVKSFIY